MRYSDSLVHNRLDCKHYLVGLIAKIETEVSIWQPVKPLKGGEKRPGVTEEQPRCALTRAPLVGFQCYRALPLPALNFNQI